MTWKAKVCFCLWVACIILWENGAGRAADWVLAPSIETRAEYLNNTFYSARLKKSDYILSAEPKLNFTYNTEVTQVGATLRLTGEHYIQNPTLDNINQYYYINANTLRTSRLKLNFRGTYLSTTDPTQSVVETNIFTVRQRTSALNLSPGFTYNFTERWSTDFLYNFSQITYQRNPFSNYNTHTLNNRLNYLLNEKTTLIISMTTAYSNYQKINNNIYRIGPQLGFNYKLSETMDIGFLGGANFTTYESTVRTASSNDFYGFTTEPEEQKQKTSTIGPYINISANLNWEKRKLSLSFTRSQSASTFLNQREYNYFDLNYNHKVTERLNLSINPSFNISSRQGGLSNYNQYYYGSNQRITYKLTEKTSIGANYRIAYVTNSGSKNNSCNINHVSIFLNYEYPIHYQQ